MKKVLIVQIDSVPLDVIKIAINKGYLPFIKSLIDKGYNLQEMFSGIPSTTPASQINLFYGISLLPGFRFVIKKENIVFAPQYIETIELLEKSTYLKNKKGLLRDGMGIMSVFSGGSSKSISIDMVKRDKKILLRSILFLFNPFTFIWRFLRIFILYIVERSEQKKNKNADLLPKMSAYVWYRIMHEVLFGEIAYMAVKVAIPTDDKVIFVNFTGYDEISHHHGGYSNSALDYLSIIDIYIRNLYQETKKNNNIRELIIISDHGQTPCIPEVTIIGCTIGEKIASLFPRNKIVQHKLKYKSTMLEKSDLYLLNSGGVCLVYNPRKEKQLSRKELETEYGNFCEKVSSLNLVVDLVLVREKNLVAVKNGKTYDFELKNASILFPFFDKLYQKKAIDWLIVLMNGPFAPDACILAKILNKNKMVNFENQLSTHGGIGGYQTQSFILSREPLFHSNELPEMRDLHDVLEQQVFGN